MAYAAKTTREITREVTETVDVVRLDLSKEEAETLAVILSAVGGNRYTSPRGHSDSISTALTRVVGGYHTLNAYGLISGSIRFLNSEDE